MNKYVSQLVKKISLVTVALTVTFSAWAITLDQAKQQGLVGEMPNGYLGVVISSTEVSHLVDSVNQKRKDIYVTLARKNKLSMKQVTALAGDKAINKTQSGHLIKDASGKWVKK